MLLQNLYTYSALMGPSQMQVTHAVCTNAPLHNKH